MKLAAVIVLAWSARFAHAAPRSVTLAAAVEAGDVAPEARADASRLVATEAEVRAAGGWAPPSLSVASSRLTARLITTLALPLPYRGEAAAAQRVARAEAGGARAAVATARLDRRLAVTVAWLALARAQAMVALAGETATTARELEAAARVRLDAGDVPAVDVDAARALRVRAEVEAEAAAGEVSARGAELAGLLGWDTDLVADGELPAPTAPPDLAHARAAERAHPELQAAAAQVEVARARIDERRRARWPALALDVEISAFDPADGRTDVKAGVTVELPLFDRHSAALGSARAGERTARAEVEVERLRVDAAIVAAHRRLLAAVARATAFSTEVLPAQAQAATQATRAYREGAADLSSALLAQRELLAVRVEVVDAVYAAAVARAELDRAAGGAP